MRPSTSSFWSEEPIQALLGHPGLSKHVVFDRSLVMLVNSALCGAVETCDALAFLNSISVSFTSAKPECSTLFPVVEAKERVPEERFENAGDGVCNDDWSANELPADLRHDVLQQIPKEIRRQVRKAHVGLGTPQQDNLSPHDEARRGFSCCVGIRKSMAMSGFVKRAPVLDNLKKRHRRQDLLVLPSVFVVT